MSDFVLNDAQLGDFERYYMNSMQLLANVIDPNMLYIVPWARPRASRAHA